MANTNYLSFAHRIGGIWWSKSWVHQLISNIVTPINLYFCSGHSLDEVLEYRLLIDLFREFLQTFYNRHVVVLKEYSDADSWGIECSQYRQIFYRMYVNAPQNWKLQRSSGIRQICWVWKSYAVKRWSSWTGAGNTVHDCVIW